MEINLLMLLWMTFRCALVALLIVFTTIYYWSPAQLVKLLIWFLFKLRRVKVKYLQHEDYTFCYFSQGKPGPQPSMLLFHGFSLAKDMWLHIIDYIPKDIHVVCVDLPGHGGTTRLPGESYSAIDQAKRMHQFVECSGLNRKPFHLVGISMGGMVAGNYAALYPSDIHCLSLLCPGGLRYPTDNDFVKRLKEQEKCKDFENIPLVPVTIQQLEELFKNIIYRSTEIIDKQIMKGYLDFQKRNVPFYTKCLFDLCSMESRYSLHDNINKITVPTQIIWGKHDQIFDPAGGEIFASAIPSCHVHMLDKCGHLIIADRPRKSTKLIVEFHASIYNKKKT